MAERYEEVCATWDYDEPGMILDKQQITVPDDVQLLELLRSWVGDLSA
jgi:hypothetical protein